MAKSNSFFGLRRGSTKSLTFQVLDGKQITKDRVSSVRNPKSNGQIMQRMKLSAAGVIYRYFKTYIDRGQQGVTYGTKSRQAWLKQVLVGPPLYNGKGNSVLLPWSFPLTKGSLPTIGASWDGITEKLTFPADATGATVTDAQLLAANPWLQDGDQIAVVVMAKRSDGTYFIRHASHILDEDGTTLMYNDLAANGIDFIEETRGEDEDTYNVAIFQSSDGTIAGTAVILSRLNGSVYERSTEDFLANDDMFSTAFKNICIDSYRDASQKTSDWPEIVEQGFIPMGFTGQYSINEVNDITGRLLYVYGFNGNEYKRYFVTQDGTASGTPYLYPSIERTEGALTAWHDNADITYTAAEAGISKAEFDALFG